MCLNASTAQPSPMKMLDHVENKHARCIIESRRHKANHTHQNLTEERKNQFKIRIFGGDGDEFSDSEDPTSLENDMRQMFGT